MSSGPNNFEATRGLWMQILEQGSFYINQFSHCQNSMRFQFLTHSVEHVFFKLKHAFCLINLLQACFNSGTNKLLLFCFLIRVTPGSYKCTICMENFLSDKDLRAHHIEAHPGGLPWECSICHRTFQKKIAMKAHMRVHNTITKYQCSSCKK